MTLEDPFYVVKDEVFRALNKTRGLYLRWQELLTSPVLPNSAEVEWTSIELRSALRSIEWDLEDLEDTISIAEKNSSKFKIDHKEICDRRTFIEATKQEVQVMKNKTSINRNIDNDGTAQEPLLGDGSPRKSRNMWTPTPKCSKKKYLKLNSEADSPNRSNEFENGMGLPDQEEMLEAQDEQLSMINNSVNTLKSVSTYIGHELNDQTILIDDLNSEMELTDSQLHITVMRVTKALHLTNDKYQCAGIVILIAILLLLLILFVVL
ncbi:syntaxin-6 [Pieris brassicae]|uniref:syntaxin-6 n=1 Tax=Pieris brassicae TaxID=7116 RepID=UPI001E661746|nr:syntaxin-6 [Pieris brassicae]